jgi:hypothetical protein
MVGHQVLVLSIGVRVPASQQWQMEISTIEWVFSFDMTVWKGLEPRAATHEEWMKVSNTTV